MSKRKAPANTYWRGPVLWAKVSVKGQTYRQSLRTDDPAVARRRVEEFRRELTGRAHFSEANRSFDEVMAAWGQGIADRVSKTTAKRYLCSLGQLEPFLAGKTLADVKGELLTEIINGRRSTGATIATIKRDLVALSSVMGFAIDEGSYPGLGGLRNGETRLRCQILRTLKTLYRRRLVGSRASYTRHGRPGVGRLS
jgi:integrase/recombinase XerD